MTYQLAGDPVPVSEPTLRLGRDVMTALLGVDTLYRRESGDQDGLAVLNLDTTGDLAPEGFDSYQTARIRWDELAARADTLAEPDRREYYRALCDSTRAFMTWRERGLPFEGQLSDFLRVPAEPASEPSLDRLRSEMRSALTELGYSGDLSTQAAAWEARHRVPPADVPEVLTELLSEAWDRTTSRLIEIPAPKSDGMRVVATSGVAFNARCDYLSRRIEVNTDPIATRPGLKHLAVHEGYPGHYLQFKLRETWYARGLAAADGLLSVVNTASSSVFEGIADIGTRAIDWIEGLDDRFQLLSNRYRAGIGTGAAWRLHALGWSEPRVTDWLRTQALTGGEGWVANRMAFIRAPARAVLIWSYWWGEPTVAAAWDVVPIERRPEFLEFLHGRMHSTRSVGMFS